MDIEEVIYEGPSKFMWDGEVYDTEAAAQAKESEYIDQGFEVRTRQQDDKFLLYTRRVVSEIIVEGEAPM